MELLKHFIPSKTKDQFNIVSAVLYYGVHKGYFIEIDPTGSIGASLQILERGSNLTGLGVSWLFQIQSIV